MQKFTAENERKTAQNRGCFSRVSSLRVSEVSNLKRLLNVNPQVKNPFPEKMSNLEGFSVLWLYGDSRNSLIVSQRNREVDTL